MTENTYYKPRLIIGGKEIIKGMSGSVTFNGDSKLQTCQCKITDPDLQNFRLMNKKIEVYLNYGSDDGVPIFRGVIHEVTPSDNFTSIKALDVRNVLVGKSSRLLQLTDDENYDGYTLAAFLYDVIDNKININETIIGLDFLRDTNPTVVMSNIRNEPKPIYEIATSAIKEAIDKDNLEKQLTFFIDIKHDGNKSNITLVKEKQLTDEPSLYLSNSDGIISYKYNRRAPVNYATGNGVTFTYGSTPQGISGINIEGDFKDKKTARTAAIEKVLLEHVETDEISLESTKGHYISLGSIVNVNVEKEDINGNHRLTSKKISFNDAGVKLSLSLNKKPIKLKKYDIWSI